MKNIIAHAKIYTKYNLTLEDYSLEAKVSKDEITLRPLKGHEKFIFEKSTPETINNLALLMLKVVELSKGEK